MGFGLLFIGYFVAFLMSINPYGWAFRIVGFYLIFRALGKLVEYKHSVKRCVIPLAIMTLCQTFEGILALKRLASITASWGFLEGNLVTSLSNTVFVVTLMIFHLLLLYSIRELAQSIGDSSIAALAFSGNGVVLLYFLLNILTAFLPTGAFKQVLMPVTALSSIVYPLFILYLLYRCYAGICSPEEENAPKKPSRFAFINKRREMSAQNDREMRELAAELDRRRQQKKMQKQERKKK